MSTARDKLLKELFRETEYYAPHTRRQYFNHVNSYLDYVGDVGDWKDRDTLYTYAKKLRKTHSQDYVNYIIRGPIGALFRCHGLRIPIKLPRVSVDVDISERVRFEPEQVAALVAAARASGDTQAKALLAISTVYGPRAGELLKIRSEDLHPKKQTIIIRTLKHGLKREHLIPEAILPPLFGYDYQPISLARLYATLDRVAEQAGIVRVQRKSFHAIRHALIDALKYEAGLDDEKISRFTGWREKGMVGKYAKLFPFQPKLDFEIFEKHPFLKLWE
ncbi:MAG: hypothetical protein Q8P59_01930 [Dehalococcoidia bacterium]|nr:hypothetical protein [Dehalococcoidia bacterium]